MVPLMKQRRLERLDTSEDEIVLAALTSGTLISDQRYWEGPVRINNFECRSKEECRAEWARTAAGTIDSKGLLGPAKEGYNSHDWVSAATQLLSEADYLKAMEVRFNVFSTLSSRSRGRPDMNPVCQDCQDYATLGHISQTCPRGYKLRNKWHNDIARFLCGRLRQRGWQVIPYGRTWRKPDIVVWKDGDNLARVFDVQVVADGFCLEAAQKRKVNKYSEQPIIDSIKAITGCPEVKILAATLNWRGCMAGSVGSALGEAGISKNDIQIVAVKALIWTYGIHQAYIKRGRLQ